MPPLMIVVMPVYNGEEYLVLALNSILDQKLSVFELIVVDDHSTDRTPQLLNEVHDDRLRIHRHAHNQGVANTLDNVSYG